MRALGQVEILDGNVRGFLAVLGAADDRGCRSIRGWFVFWDLLGREKSRSTHYKKGTKTQPPEICWFCFVCFCGASRLQDLVVWDLGHSLRPSFWTGGGVRTRGKEVVFPGSVLEG